MFAAARGAGAYDNRQAGGGPAARCRLAKGGRRCQEGRPPAGGFLDKGKQYDYAITRSRSQSLWIDTNQVKEGEIKSYKDLLDPRWKGKILAGDLRTKGSGFWTGTALRIKTGSDDIIRQLWKDQDALL